MFQEDEDDITGNAEGVGQDNGDVCTKNTIRKPQAHAEREEQGHAVGDVREAFRPVAFDELGEKADGCDGAGEDAKDGEGVDVHFLRVPFEMVEPNKLY